MAEARLDFQSGQLYGCPPDVKIMKCEDQDYMDYGMYDGAERTMRETDQMVSQIKRQKATRSY